MTRNAGKSIRSVRKIAVIAGVCLATLGATCVCSFAQEISSFGSSTQEQITIQPYPYTVNQAPISNFPLNPEVLSVSRPLSYSDLDLSNPADAKELERRITETAVDVCREFDRRFPARFYPSVRQDRPRSTRRYDCVESAVDNAMAAVRQHG